MGTSKIQIIRIFDLLSHANITISIVAIGEVLNFSAYSFAPPILVTPLGALSVILG